MNKKGFIKVVIISTILIFVVVIVYFALLQKSNGLKTGFKTILYPQTAPQNKEVSWRTYQNEKYGFEVKYPGNWALTQGGGYFNFNDSKYLNSYTDVALLSIGFDDPTGYFKEVSKESNLLETFSVFGYKYVAKTFFFTDYKKVYVYCMFDRYDPKSTETDFRQVLNICNKILSTLKFTR